MGRPINYDQMRYDHWPIGVDDEGQGPVRKSDPAWIEDICAKCLQEWPCDESGEQ